MDNIRFGGRKREDAVTTRRTGFSAGFSSAFFEGNLLARRLVLSGTIFAAFSAAPLFSCAFLAALAAALRAFSAAFFSRSVARRRTCGVEREWRRGGGAAGDGEGESSGAVMVVVLRRGTEDTWILCVRGFIDYLLKGWK
jgi:hypothetical protein